MPWQIKMIDEPPEEGLQIGMMWFVKATDEQYRRMYLTKYYWERNADRKPLRVMLPDGVIHTVDGQCYSKEKGFYDGWEVTGTPPNITITPSINVEGRYHGHITDGVIGDPL